MKAINYKDAHHVFTGYGYHVGSPQYGIDWDHNEEKYKMPNEWLRVYQSGYVDVLTNGWGKPDARHALSTFGINMLLKDQVRGKITTPDGRPVLKKDLNQDIFLHDEEHGRLLAGRRFHYVAPGYPPKSDSKATTVVRNPAKEKEFMDTWKDTFDLGTTLYGLRTSEMSMSLLHTMHAWLRSPRPLDPVVDLTLLQILGSSGKSEAARVTLTGACSTRENFDYLRIQP